MVSCLVGYLKFIIIFHFLTILRSLSVSIDKRGKNEMCKFIIFFHKLITSYINRKSSQQDYYSMVGDINSSWRHLWRVMNLCWKNCNFSTTIFTASSVSAMQNHFKATRSGLNSHQFWRSLIRKLCNFFINTKFSFDGTRKKQLGSLRFVQKQ